MPKRKTARKSRKRKSRKSKRKSRKSRKRKSRKSRKRKSRKSRKRKSRKSRKRKSRKSRKRKSRKSRKRKSRKSRKRKSRKSADSPKKGLRGVRLKKGELEGYKLSDTVLERRRTLGIHVYEKGYLPVMKRVNVLSIFLRNKSPQLSKNAESDKKWLMKRHKQGGKEERWVPRRVDGTGFFR